MDLQAPVVAAIIAAVVSGINIIITVRTSRQQMAVQLAIKNRELRAADVAEARQSLQALARLAGRLSAATKRLLDNSETLDDSDMIEQTANTLSVVSEFFSGTNEDSLVMIPDPIVPTLKSIRKDLVAFLLELQMKKVERVNAKAKLAVPYGALTSDLKRFQDSVRQFLNPFAEPRS